MCIVTIFPLAHRRSASRYHAYHPRVVPRWQQLGAHRFVPRPSSRAPQTRHAGRPMIVAQ